MYHASRSYLLSRIAKGIQPFQQCSPRKAPPGTGEGGVNDNTGVWEDASLADGTWILLLLSVMMLCFKISTKKTKS